MDPSSGLNPPERWRPRRLPLRSAIEMPWVGSLTETKRGAHAGDRLQFVVLFNGLLVSSPVICASHGLSRTGDYRKTAVRAHLKGLGDPPKSRGSGAESNFGHGILIRSSVSCKARHTVVTMKKRAGLSCRPRPVAGLSDHRANR